MFAPFVQNRYFCRLKFHSMRKTAFSVLFSVLVAAVLSGCSGYNKILKASDYNTKYSLAKSYFMEGRYTMCSSILEECVAYQRGTAQAEESMYLLATCYYNLNDYLSASQYYMACYRAFPNSTYSESCLYWSWLGAVRMRSRVSAQASSSCLVSSNWLVMSCRVSSLRRSPSASSPICCRCL